MMAPLQKVAPQSGTTSICSSADSNLTIPPSSTEIGSPSVEEPPHYFDQSRGSSAPTHEARDLPSTELSPTAQMDHDGLTKPTATEATTGKEHCSAAHRQGTPQGEKAEPKDFGGLCTGKPPTMILDSEKEIPHHVFGKKFVWLLLSLVIAAGTLSGLASNVFFPAQNDIAAGLGTSVQTVNLSITTYLIAQAIAPSFWGPLADFAGRRSILIATLLVFVFASLGLALSCNAGMLLVFRALQAIGSSSTIALGAGVIADISTPGKRGSYLGMFSGMRQMSMAFGPVIGGLLAGSLGWRYIFWFLLAFSGAVLTAIVLFLPETLRRIAGNGSTPLTRFQYRPLLYPCLSIGRKSKAPSADPEEAAVIDASEKEIGPRPAFHPMIFVQPLSYLLEKDVACALFFGATVYTAWSMMVASTSYLLKELYHFTTLQIGIAFLANGTGCMLGSIISGRTLDATFRRESRLYQHSKYLPPTTPTLKSPLPLGFPLERARLGDAPMYSAIMILGLLIFGWSLTTIPDEKELTGHWIAPLLAQFMIGFSNTAVLTSNNTLVVDLYPGKSASASAVINLSRCLTAALGVALVDSLLQSTSPGWLSVVLVGLVLAGLGPYILHVKYGGMWRRQREERRGSVVVSPM